MQIDSHHHFWRYNAGEYGWIDDSKAAIRRDFLPADLEREISAAGVDGVVSVQARQIEAETKALLDFCDKNDFIRGVVGWVPLINENVSQSLERFAKHPKLKAVRHVLHDEADDRYMLREDFNRGISMLHSFDLVYDILIFEKHLPQTLQFVGRHPDQIFVIDHIAKPLIKDNVLSPWQSLIVELSKRPNVYCKVSGMVTEADHINWTEKQLKPYVDTVLHAFGPERLMFGSDWPVCLLACEYGRWHGIVSGWVSDLSQTDRDRIMGGTAIEAYGL